MGYYMRFFSTDARDITLPWLEAELKRIDSRYSIERDERKDKEMGLLYLADGNYGQFEINRPHDGLFEGEIEEFMDALGAEGDADSGKGQQLVRGVLEQATCIVALQVFFEERGTDATFEGLDPLWRLLFDARKGLLQADGEGFYRGSELVLPG